MEYKCLPKCSFTNCVDQLNFVITKGSLNQIKQYVNDACLSALQRLDSKGRTPLHIAATCGKVDVVRWLLDVALKTKINYSLQTYIDMIDFESGWTALHKAVYYGRVSCVMELIKNGANMWIKDCNGCNIFNLLIDDVSPWCYDPIITRFVKTTLESWSGLKRTDPTEVYTWGVNENMTLAQGSQNSRKIPEVVEFFARDKISIKQVVMCKFHSVFLTHGGKVYSCGNGRGGKLGISNENVFIQPQLIELSEVIVKISANINNTFFITEDGQLFVCGMNTFRTLGINPPPDKCLLPTRSFSLKDQKIIGCCAASFHTVVWSNLNAVYTFGVNAGQLGHAKGDLFVVQPRQVSALHKDGDEVVWVDACDAATAVATKQGTIHLLYKFICRKIVTKQMDICKIQIGGGKLDSFVMSQIMPMRVFTKGEDKYENEKNNIKVLILKNTGILLSWSSSHATLDRCQLDTRQINWISDISMCENGSSVLIICAKGTAYLSQYSTWHAGKTKKNNSNQNKQVYTSLELFKAESIQKLKCDQLPCAFRAHTGVLGPKGRNLAILQSDPCNFITEIPTVDEKCSMGDDLKTFWNQTSTNDRLNNIQIHLKRSNKPNINYAAHQFILASRSRAFFRLFSDSALSEDIALEFDIMVENVYPFVLSNVLDYIYTGSCELLQVGNDVDKELNYLGTPTVYCKYTGQDLLANAKSKTKHMYENSQKEMKVFDMFKQLSFLLEVKDLTESTFNNMNIKDGILLSTGQQSFPKIHFSPKSLSFLCNCNVECDDKVVYKAHKSILAARIPFFRGMLFSPWMEANINGQNVLAHLKVPLPSDVFRYLLSFAYTDSQSCLSAALTVESLCEVLAAADLLLMDRLKQVTEQYIVPKLNLKNVVLVTEVALAFNSKQLHKTCLQFACQNLPALIHTPNFHAADQDMLEELENTYRGGIATIYMRAMPASRCGPSVDHYSEIFDDPLTNEDIGYSKFSSSSFTKKTLSFKSRRKSNKKEFGVMLSDLLNKSNQSAEYEIVNMIVTTAPQTKINKSKNNIPNNNTTFSNKASDVKIENSKSKAALIDKNKREPPSLQSTSPITIKPSIAAIEIVPQRNKGYENLFPTLGFDDCVRKASPQSPDSKIKPGASGRTSLNAKPIKKLSQKERRRLQEEMAEESKKQIAPISPPNAWGVQPVVSPITQSPSFWESPEKTGCDTVRPIQTIVKNNGPWQTFPSNFATSLPLQSTILTTTSPNKLNYPTSLIEVIESEQLNKDNTEKSSKKSLSIIQMEEQAMEELKLFYDKKHQKSRHKFIVSRLSFDDANFITNQRKSKLLNR